MKDKSAVSGEVYSVCSVDHPCGKIDVHYRVVGQGPLTIVLIHGAACDMSVWEGQIKSLLEWGRIILIDLPGHGLSSKPQICYSIRLFAESVNAVLDEVGAREAILVGHSMGAQVLRDFYSRWPDKTRSLIVVDGVIYRLSGGLVAKTISWLINSPLYFFIWSAIVKRMVGKRLTSEQKLRISDLMIHAKRHVVRSLMDRSLTSGLNFDRKISVPLLALFSDDPLWGAELEDRVGRESDDLRFIRLKDSGHFLMMERPTELNGLFQSFIRQTAGLDNV